jgi:hypothetical protein
VITGRFGGDDRAKHNVVNAVLIFRMGGAIAPLPLYALMVCTGMKVNIYRPCLLVSGLINSRYRVCYGIYAWMDDFVMLHTHLKHEQ